MSLLPTYQLSIATLGSLLWLCSASVPAVQAQRSGGLPELGQPQPPIEAVPTQETVPKQIAAPTAAPAAVPTPPIPAESSYTLGAGDVVNVRIFRVPQYSGESQVSVDGALTLPLVGKINVDGLSLEAASDLLTSQYGQFLRRPIVTLSLSSRRPLQVGIAGEVSRPGSYNIDQNNTQSARLTQLIETAGGITQGRESLASANPQAAVQRRDADD